MNTPRIELDPTHPLARYLIRRKLTVAEFGRQAGLPQSMIWRYAHGQRTPSLRHALTIERATKGEVQAEAWVKGVKR